jgi:hypothetical protein
MNARLAQRPSIWESPAPVSAEPVRTWSTIAAEREVLVVLEGPLAIGETAATGFKRIEQELGDLFATLTVLDSRELHRRLSSPALDDAIAIRFGRMVIDRRHRLLAFLADAPRREAFKRAGRCPR